jgi:hypothetical protein
MTSHKKLVGEGKETRMNEKTPFANQLALSALFTNQMITVVIHTPSTL